MGKYNVLRMIRTTGVYIRTSSKSTYYKTSSLRQFESIKRYLLEQNISEGIIEPEYIYTEACSDGVPIVKRLKLSLLIYNIENKNLKYVFVESFDRLSRNFMILKEIRDKAIEHGTTIVSINSDRDLREMSEIELKNYSSFLLEEKSLLIKKLQSLKELNKQKDIYIPGRKNLYLTDFTKPEFRELWPELVGLPLREISKRLFEKGYKTITGRPLALATVSKLKKYYIDQINK